MREGSNEARISIRLRNRGPDSYRRDVYGSSIIVVRSIKRDGASGYKIKAANGRVIEQKADEVRQICDAFNIQVIYLSISSGGENKHATTQLKTFANN